MKNLGIKYFLSDLKAVHMFFEQTMDGVTPKVASFAPGGTANPIAGLYAHIIFSEDFFARGILEGKKPLFDSTWKGKTGISKPQPTDWEKEYPKWIKTVKVDLKQTPKYAKAVFKSTEKYVGSLKDVDLEGDVDMSIFGMGKRPLGDVLSGFIIGHAYSIMGEIAVIKGIQGLKGYPF